MIWATARNLPTRSGKLDPLEDHGRGLEKRHGDESSRGNQKFKTGGGGEGRAYFHLGLEGQRNFDIPVTQFMSVIGRYLGWSKIKSNWFEVEVKDGEAHFKGRGLGHGVGMCQWGAKGMADLGKKFNEILFSLFSGYEFDSTVRTRVLVIKPS